MPPPSDEKSNAVRIDGLLKLADTCWRSMDHRRSYEWKVNLALWSALGLFSGLQLRGQISIRHSSMYQIAVSIFLLAILWIYVFNWTPGIQKRNAEDVFDAHYYWNLVEDHLGIAPPSRRKNRNLTPREESVWQNWSHRAQILFTTVLVAISICVTIVATG